MMALLIGTKVRKRYLVYNCDITPGIDVIMAQKCDNLVRIIKNGFS